jgi:hypothetical protein
MAKALLSIKMDISIKDNFKIIKNLDKVRNYILMVIYMLALFGKIKNMAKALFIGSISVPQHAPKMLA